MNKSLLRTALVLILILIIAVYFSEKGLGEGGNFDSQSSADWSYPNMSHWEDGYEEWLK